MRSRVEASGTQLSVSLCDLLEDVNGLDLGPQRLAERLGVDKVLTSRLLKAVRHPDPLGTAYHMPGPAPLRRLLKAAKRRGVETGKVARATAALDRFEALISEGAGDRSSLDAMLSSWLPEARLEFELRRRQSAYKAMSHLKGASASMSFSAVILSPSDDGKHIDVVWVIGMLGLRRLRPGVECKFATRRMASEQEQRQPRNLDGEIVEGIDRARLDQFCFARPAPLEARRVGDTLQYTLGNVGFGPRSNVDIVFAEVNRRELFRSLPKGAKRKGFFFADVQTPTKTLHFDTLVHPDIYPNSEPELLVYDTSVDGVADVNDPTRDIDRFPCAESIQRLGRGLPDADAGSIPNYRPILAHVFEKLGWKEDRYRAYRCRLEFPIYGSQVCMAFAVPEHD